MCIGIMVKCDPKQEATKGIDDQFTHPSLQTHYSLHQTCKKVYFKES